MRVAAIAIIICLTCLITGVGCSKDEPSLYTEKEAVVRKPINKPVQGRREALTSTQNVPALPEVQEEKSIETNSIEISGNDEEASTIIEYDEGIYITDKGDSLSTIAGRKDVYGDSLKWPILYRFNQEKFHQLPKGSDFPEREISKGTMLHIITMDEAKENLKNRPKDYWVINVISSPQMDRVVPNVLKLIDNGFPAYMRLVNVKGKDYIRIRVGFFGDRKDAEKEGEKIMATLNISDIWATRAGDEERGEFGGY
jgi:hypothetical protein